MGQVIARLWKRLIKYSDRADFPPLPLHTPTSLSLQKIAHDRFAMKMEEKTKATEHVTPVAPVRSYATGFNPPFSVGKSKKEHLVGRRVVGGLEKSERTW